MFNLRNPKGLMAMVGIAILNGFLFSAVFNGVGLEEQVDLGKPDTTWTPEFIKESTKNNA